MILTQRDTAELNSERISFQRLLTSDGKEYQTLVNIKDSVGINLFIGEEDLLYKGFGPQVIRRFIEEAVFADTTVEVCVVDSEPENAAAIRAYKKAGFRYFKSVDTSEGPAFLMKIEPKECFG